MSDSPKQDSENQFADHLEKELQAREQNQFLDRVVVNSDDSNIRRIQKVAPVLDLLVEFQHQPEILATHTELETGNRKSDATLQPASEFPIPRLDRLGRFQIHDEIGRGGNGIVFRAKDLQLDRIVALKIPRLSAALSGDTKIRFEREAKAAASLNHPSIVAVHEVGHERGLDYIVSQFVEGVSLAQWQETHAVTADQAAACIANLADAMQHAHDRGVLHRDLKPSNILVEDSDLELAERCQIVDFGLAAIKQEAAEDLTAAGSMIGTPAYMSPEQTRSNSNISASTDVYGLGAILYQLLTGQAPFNGNDIIELVEKVRSQDAVSPAKIKPHIPADLAAIALKCLEKKPERRYPSVNELQRDLARYLNNEPVSARSASMIGRLQKWVQRNSLVTALILTLLVGVLATSYAAIRASIAESKSRLSEERTKVEAENVLAVSEYLEEMFQIPSVLARNKNKLRGKDVTAEEILDHAANKIQDDLDSRPGVKARLMTIIGASISSIGKYKEAEDLLRSGLRLNLDNPERSDLQCAKSHFELGRLLRNLDRFDEAENHTRSAIAILEKESGGDQKLLANCYNHLGLLLRPKDLLAARAAYVTARDLIEVHAPGKSENWTLSANIATLDYLSGNYDLAADSYEHALRLAVESHGESHPKVAILLGNLAKVNLRLGKIEEARKMRMRELEVIENEFGVDHAEYGFSLLGLSNVQQKLGDWQAALETGSQSVQVLKSAFPRHHRQTVAAINNYVVTLIRTSQFEKAKMYTQEIEESDKHRVGDEPDFQMLKNQLLISQVDRMSGDHESALARIEFVLNHELSEKNKSIGTDARFAKAFYLAETGGENREASIADAIQYAKSTKTLADTDRSYSEAIFWALANQPQKAIQFLELAIDSGYKDARILGEPDLASLESMDSFQQIQSEVRRRLGGN